MSIKSSKNTPDAERDVSWPNAKLLRDLIKEFGIAIKEVAAGLPLQHRVTMSAVHHWVTGRSRPEEKIWLALNQMFGGKLPPEGWLTESEKTQREKRKEWNKNVAKTNADYATEVPK